ncbi:MAG: hypothetical protein J6M34_04400 [Clostridia bacterium]|nr:hypothetical protein [Clostridia bacterium]
MRKLKGWHITLFCGLLLGAALFALWFFNCCYLYTPDNLSLTYARNQSSFPSMEENSFYVRDNLLYFAEDRGDKVVVRVVKNNVIRTFAEIPKNYKRFLVLDDETMLVQVKDTLYLMNTEDENLVELWSGTCVGYHGDQVYLTDETALYAAKITETEPQKVVSFHEILASYEDGIVYRNGDGIYQLFYEKTNVPQLLTNNAIPWPNEKTELEFSYLYTTDYALRIGSHTLDLYFYKTGEMRRIYETEANHMVIMAVSAGMDGLYVSRQWVDAKFWPLKNSEINGTYRYDIQGDLWTRISDETCSTLARFDDSSVYGYDRYSTFPSVKQFEVN